MISRILLIFSLLRMCWEGTGAQLPNIWFSGVCLPLLEKMCNCKLFSLIIWNWTQCVNKNMLQKEHVLLLNPFFIKWQSNVFSVVSLLSAHSALVLIPTKTRQSDVYGVGCRWHEAAAADGCPRPKTCCSASVSERSSLCSSQTFRQTRSWSRENTKLECLELAILHMN